MKIQSSYIEEKATLYLVPTPIGNIADMTYRAVEILKNVDYIYCEDTRVTKVLLSHFQITAPLRNYHLYNENLKTPEILTLLEKQMKVAIVSDAGLPCISDPGYQIAKEAIDRNFNVISLPGASAGITALVASGIAPEKFYFHGFLNSRQASRIKELQELQDLKMTLIIYEAPHRLKATLQDINQVLGNRQIAIARELTKKYEQYIRGTVAEIINQEITIKGEIVIIIEGSQIKAEIATLNLLTICEHFNYYCQQNYDSKEAMKKVANDRHIAKSEVYRQLKVKDYDD